MPVHVPPFLPIIGAMRDGNGCRVCYGYGYGFSEGNSEGTHHPRSRTRVITEGTQNTPPTHQLYRGYGGGGGAAHDEGARNMERSLGQPLGLPLS